MAPSVLTQVVLPIALLTIMLGMGLSLVLDDFRRVLRYPKAVVVGVICQMLVLPLIGYGVVRLFDMPPALGVGLVILALCPGGTTSNMITYLARGDVALSISLTAVVSIVTPFTIPLLGGAAMRALMGDAVGITLPFGKTVLTLLAITVVPVVIGMLIKKRWPRFATKTERPVQVLSIVFLFAIIAGVISKNWAEMPSFFAQTGWAALTLNAVAMVVGFAVARAAKLGRAQTTTISIEVGIQNGTTALFITGTLLSDPTMSIAPAIYSLVMFGTGAVFAVLLNTVWAGPSDVAAGDPA